MFGSGTLIFITFLVETGLFAWYIMDKTTPRQKDDVSLKQRRARRFKRAHAQLAIKRPEDTPVSLRLDTLKIKLKAKQNQINSGIQVSFDDGDEDVNRSAEYTL
jgi:hypothetical protein